MNCANIVSSFLSNINISNDISDTLCNRLVSAQSSNEINVSFEEGVQTIHRILVDTYSLNSEKVKKCADIITKKFGPIGRYEKDLIKHYLDYNDEDSLELLASIDSLGISSKELSSIINSEREDLSGIAVNKFIENWNKAIEAKDESKLFDFLQGLYSRLTDILGSGTLSLLDIYKYNSVFIDKELKPSYQTELIDFCSNDRQISAKDTRYLFCKKYEEILAKSLQEDSRLNRLEQVMNLDSSIGTPFSEYNAEEFGLVFININQQLYNACANDNDFYDLVLSLLYYSYRVLDNHRTLAINIDNIYNSFGQNLKWMLYSYIGIYAEHFLPTVEHRMFYKPEELCYDKCEYLNIPLTDDQKSAIKFYFKKTLDKQSLLNILEITEHQLDDILLDFDKIWYGYTFSDCIAVKSGIYDQNSEISFIENTNQILLIFNKYRHDDRKIPCPECAGLDISGNSFPEVGLRSWECKNPICPSRSKSNRGKRYSKKSNFMQESFDIGKENDQIPRDLIKNWRRDIASVKSQAEIHHMLVKYFSFDQDNVLFVNTENESSITIQDCNRNPSIITFEQVSSMKKLEGAFENYFNNDGYTTRYLHQITYPESDLDPLLNNSIQNTSRAMLVHGNSRDVLAKINDNTFTAAVTSPPYYNARLYSQWPNLYLYLSDMYEIIKETYRTMKPGGIYLYNIGDICGNENTVVSSTMGNKRIPLGAYTIHLFTAAGFELLDNILWDKGNPQSNRQKNDGKFTPYYQKPMNVYEHMFVFKKPGASAIITNNIANKLPKEWKTNIAPFSPVIKINSKGENTLGHTAPFPEDIPNFVAKVFTRSPEDIVLEPFAGSGTSLISCSKCGVKSLGIELCNEYVELILDQGHRNNITIKKI